MTGTPSHPDVGPDYIDKTGQAAKLVRCPDCGQMEWWTEDESLGHGRCRTGQYPCVCDEEANAQLIAGAPSLLAALEAAYTFIGEASVDGAFTASEYARAAKVLDQAHAAIALAKGEAQ